MNNTVESIVMDWLSENDMFVVTPKEVPDSVKVLVGRIKDLPLVSGVRDVNGVEICHGDKVRFAIISYGPGGEQQDLDNIGIVKYSDYEKAWVIGDEDSDYYKADLIMLGDAHRADPEMEIIYDKS